MFSNESLKPGLYGAAIGAAALAIVGFAWGGWVTQGTAQKMAADQAQAEVVAALVPICLEQSAQDPKVVETLAFFAGEGRYGRIDAVMDAGWATMPGAEAPNRPVATACMLALAERL